MAFWVSNHCWKVRHHYWIECENLVLGFCYVKQHQKSSSRNGIRLGQTFLKLYSDSKSIESKHIEIFISCFVEDIDRSWKLKKNSLDGSQSFFCARLFQ